MTAPQRVLQVSCLDCAADLEHCHGTAILHIDGLCDCTDDVACRLPVEAHVDVMTCTEHGCVCEGLL